MFFVQQIDIAVILQFLGKNNESQIKMIKNWNFDLIIYRISNSRPSTLATTFTVRTGGLMSKLYKTSLFGILNFCCKQRFGNLRELDVLSVRQLNS